MGSCGAADDERGQELSESLGGARWGIATLAAGSLIAVSVAAVLLLTDEGDADPSVSAAVGRDGAMGFVEIEF